MNISTDSSANKAEENSALQKQRETFFDDIMFFDPFSHRYSVIRYIFCYHNTGEEKREATRGKQEKNSAIYRKM